MFIIFQVMLFFLLLMLHKLLEPKRRFTK